MNEYHRLHRQIETRDKHSRFVFCSKPVCSITSSITYGLNFIIASVPGQWASLRKYALLPHKTFEPIENFSKLNWLNRLQMVQFECPGHSTPSLSSILGVGRISPFPIWIRLRGLGAWGLQTGPFAAL